MLVVGRGWWASAAMQQLMKRQQNPKLLCKERSARWLASLNDCKNLSVSWTKEICWSCCWYDELGDVGGGNDTDAAEVATPWITGGNEGETRDDGWAESTAGGCGESLERGEEGLRWSWWIFWLTSWSNSSKRVARPWLMNVELTSSLESEVMPVKRDGETILMTCKDFCREGFFWK